MPEFLFVPGRSSAKTYVEHVRSHVAKSQQQHLELSDKPANGRKLVSKQPRRRTKVSGRPFDSLDFRVVTGDPSARRHLRTPNGSLTASSDDSTPYRSTSAEEGTVFPEEADPGTGKVSRREPKHPVLAKTPLLEITFMPFLIHFYLSNMAVEIPDIDLDRPGSLRSVWFPFALGNPAVMRAIILTAGSLFANTADLSPADRRFVRRHLLELKQATIEEIQNLLMDPKTALDDATVAAVLKVAACEAMFGSELSYVHHMGGLARMISMRGGTDSLGLDGVLKRMLYWVDSNAAFLLGRLPFFLDDDKPQITFDAAHFIGAT